MPSSILMPRLNTASVGESVAPYAATARKTAHFPHILPSANDLLTKTMAHPHLGGWLAHDIDVSLIDTQEPDFSNVSILQHEETLHLMDALQRQYILSKNRKSYVPGDIPNEIWRIMLNHQ